MGLFRSGPSPHQTAVSMIGVKAGKIAVVVGASDAALAAALALVTGLNGRTIVIDARADAQAEVQAAAARAGALVEFMTGKPAALPLDPDFADVVVINRVLGTMANRRAWLAEEAVRITRPGGRIVAVEGHESRGWWHDLTAARGATPMTGEALCETLRTKGLRAVRVLAEAHGVVYVEGIKARP